MTRYPALTTGQTAALQEFADAHGPRWKDELSNVYWYNARLWHGDSGCNHVVASTLHGIRNQFGPTWLRRVCKIKPAKKEPS